MVSAYFKPNTAVRFATGGNKDVLLSLAQHLCQHVLDPLLKLHPQRVVMKIQSHQDDQGSSALEVSFSTADAQQQGSYSVEGAALHHLQVVAGQAKQSS